MKKFMFPSSDYAYAGLQKLAKKRANRTKAKKQSYTLASASNYKSSRAINAKANTFQMKTFTKRVAIDSPVDTFRSGGFQYALEFTNNITQGDSIFQRERQLIMIKGIKLSLFVQSLDINNVTNLRWALISPKGGTQSTSINLNTDFYQGSNASRYVDFDQVANGLHHMTYAINRDKYTIFAQGKKTLAANALANNAGDTSSFFQLEQYIPIGETVEYNGSASFQSNNPIYLVYWLQSPLRNNIAPVPNQYKNSVHSIVYFLEPS